MNYREGSTPIVYKDLLFRVIACLLASHFIVMMGNPSIGTFQAFLDLSYYPTLIINYAIALIAAIAIKHITIALDKRHDWYADIWRRALLQFTFGVIGVSILTFFLVFVYFLSFDQDIVESGYVDYELPFSIALFTILNFYYAAYYFYRYPRTAAADAFNGSGLIGAGVRKKLTAVTVEEPEMTGFKFVDDETESVAAGIESVLDADLQGRVEPKELLLVKASKTSTLVRREDVAMIFIYERTVFLRPKGVNCLNDCFHYDTSLEELMEILDHSIFFRINRQCIISIDVVGSYQGYSDKNLLVTLRPEYQRMDGLNAKEWTKIRTVAVPKVHDFLSWIDR